MSGEFLKKKFRKFVENSRELPRKPGPRGVTTSKVENIGSLIPRKYIKILGRIAM